MSWVTELRGAVDVTNAGITETIGKQEEVKKADEDWRAGAAKPVTDMEAAQAALSAMAAACTTLRAQQLAVKGSVKKNQADVGNIAGFVDTRDSGLGTAGARLGGLETKMDDAANTMAGRKTEIEEIVTALGGLIDRVKAIQANTSIGRQSDDINREAADIRDKGVKPYGDRA